MKKVIISLIVVFMLLGAVAAAYFYIADLRQDLLPPRAVVGYVDVGGMTVEDAKDRIVNIHGNHTINIIDSFTLAEFDLSRNIDLWLDFGAAVDEVFASKSEFWVLDLFEVYVSDAEGELRFDSSLLRQVSDDFVSKWNAETEQPEDAYIVLGDDSYELVGEIKGKLLDADSVYAVLLSAVNDERGIVDLGTCLVPFDGVTADELQSELEYLNTFAGFRLEYDTGEVLNFRYLVENDWLLFNGVDVKLAEYKVIEHVIGLGDTFDSGGIVLDKASESVQLIADIYGKAQVSRPMIFRDAEEPHNPVEHVQPVGGEFIGLQEFLDDLGLNFNGYIEALDAIDDWEYPHYLSKNAFRYADYWSLNPDMPADTVFALVNVYADIEPYTETFDVYEPDTMWLLVNKRFALPPDHAPGDLTSVSGTYLMRNEAAHAFIAMRSDMRGQGLDLVVTSAYRSYAGQAEVHRGRVQSFGLERADMEAARAGHSEHQTGLALDFFHRGDVGRPESARFQDTGQFGWLLRFAHYYGYILSYPEEYLDIHGNIFEPWHWRYVGVDIATAMFEKEIGLYDEFYGKYLAPDVLYTVRELILQ